VGYYADLPADVRAQQLERMRDLSTQLYPRVRIYVFDAKMLYSSPITIFGPLLAAMYLGQNYLVFRDASRVETFIDHFDTLVRQSGFPSRSFPDVLSDLVDGTSADQ